MPESLKKTIRARSCLAELFPIAEKGNSAAVQFTSAPRTRRPSNPHEGGDAEVCDAFQEQFAQINGQAGLETGARLLPSLAPIGVERHHIGVT